LASKPRKWADSRLEILRTVFAVAGCGTLYLVAAKLGWV
jgi:hypothetical protein